MEEKDEVEIRSKMVVISPVFLLLVIPIIVDLCATTIFKMVFIGIAPSVYFFYVVITLIVLALSINNIVKKGKVLVRVDKEGIKLGNAKTGQDWGIIRKVIFKERKLKIMTDKTKNPVTVLTWRLTLAFDTNLLIEAIRKYKPESVEFDAEDEILIYPNSKHMNIVYVQQFIFFLFVHFLILFQKHIIMYSGILWVFLFTLAINSYFILSIKKDKVKYHFREYKNVESVYVSNKFLCMKHKQKEKIIIRDINKLAYTELELQEKLKGGK